MDLQAALVNAGARIVDLGAKLDARDEEVGIAVNVTKQTHRRFEQTVQDLSAKKSANRKERSDNASLPQELTAESLQLYCVVEKFSKALVKTLVIFRMCGYSQVRNQERRCIAIPANEVKTKTYQVHILP